MPPNSPISPSHLRALAGAVVMLVALWIHSQRPAPSRATASDADTGVDPDALQALFLFFALLSHRSKPADVTTPYPQRQLAAAQQALEEASFSVFPDESPAFPDNFFRYLDRPQPAHAPAAPLGGERAPVAETSGSLFGEPNRFHLAVTRLVQAAATAGEEILYHDAFPARFSERVARQRLYGAVPYLLAYCQRAEIHLPQDFTYLADVLEEAAEQRPDHASPLQRGVHWLREQAQAADERLTALPKLMWRGKTADLLEIGYALVDANYLTSAGANRSRDELVTEFAHQLGKAVSDPRRRLAKRRTPAGNSAHPTLEKLLTMYAAADHGQDGAPAAARRLRPTRDRLEKVPAAASVVSRQLGVRSIPASPAPPPGLTGLPDSAFWQQLRAVIHEVVAEAIQSHPVSPTAADPEELLTVLQAAHLLAVCRQTIHDWVRKGLLPVHKMGRRTYIKRTELLASPRRQERSRKTPERPRQTTSRPAR